MSTLQEITIIAPNIKVGGGKELLIYLLQYIDQNYIDIKTTVYVDSSMHMIQNSKNIKVVYLSSKFEKIKLFSNSFKNVLYFGNLPPLRKAQNSIVYFHNTYLIMNFSVLFKKGYLFFIKYLLQQTYIHFFIKNVDFVACQTKNIKELFINHYGYNKVIELPFFRLCDKQDINSTDKKYNFCYVSLAHPHKNHMLLLDAIQILSEKNIKFSLALTIEKDKKILLDKIKIINEAGNIYIDNLGVISKEKVCELYAKSRCLLFPSTEESFGLPLIEAVEMGLDIVASDLDYVYEVIEPSLVFDPNNSNMIADKIEEYLEGSVKKSHNKVNNSIDVLINKIINTV